MTRTSSAERTTASAHVVLGVSDSPSGRAALNVAADIAAQGRLGLTLVRVWHDDPGADGVAEQEDFAKLCADAQFRAHGVEIAAELATGELGPSLIEHSVDAALLVIGAGAAGAESAVSRWLVHHAQCPVIVVDAAEHIIDYRAGPRREQTDGTTS